MMSDRVVIAGIFLFGFAMENFFLMACAVICVTLGVVQSLIRMPQHHAVLRPGRGPQADIEADPKGRKGGGGIERTDDGWGHGPGPNLDEIRELKSIFAEDPEQLLPGQRRSFGRATSHCRFADRHEARRRTRVAQGGGLI